MPIWYEFFWGSYPATVYRQEISCLGTSREFFNTLLEEIGLVHVGVRLKRSLREPGTSGFESAIHFDLVVFVNDAALLVVKIEGEALDQIVRACELASVNVLSFATSAKRTY